jgi:hypothetical protein
MLLTGLGDEPCGLLSAPFQAVAYHPPSVGPSAFPAFVYHVPLIFSPVGLPNVSQAGLELVSGSARALLFSQCNIAWRNFIWAGDLGYQSFDSSWCFFSAKCGSSISARFLIYGAHAV